jgi:hypothetical protein
VSTYHSSSPRNSLEEEEQEEGFARVLHHRSKTGSAPMFATPNARGTTRQHQAKSTTFELNPTHKGLLLPATIRCRASNSKQKHPLPSTKHALRLRRQLVSSRAGKRIPGETFGLRPRGALNRSLDLTWILRLPMQPGRWSQQLSRPSPDRPTQRTSILSRGQTNSRGTFALCQSGDYQVGNNPFFAPIYLKPLFITSQHY